MASQIATQDVIVEQSDGVRRKIVKGDQVPPHLLSLYLDETGEEAPDGDPPAPEGAVIASETVVVEGADGLRRQIVKGTQVPVGLVEAYGEATGEDVSVPEPEGGEATKRFASDAAEERAAELGVTLDDIPEGTGKDGAVTVDDVKAAALEE